MSVITNPWFIGIVGSLISMIIAYILRAIFKPIATRNTEGKQRGSVVAIFSVCVSIIVFLCGNVLQPAMQSLMEPGGAPYFRHLEFYVKEHPDIMLASFFLASFLPGIITGLICSMGRSLKQCVWFAVVAAIVSLSILDTVFFLSGRPQFLALASRIPEMGIYADIGYYYASILANVIGGAVAGLIVGTTTYFFASLLADEAQGVAPN